MSLLTEEIPASPSGSGIPEGAGQEGIEVNVLNPMKDSDYGVVVKAFEIEVAGMESEEAARASHYRDVYGTQDFSQRVREQMDYYPGMHQTSHPPGTDPQYTNAEQMANNRLGYWTNSMDSPQGFEDGLRQKQQDFDYTKMFDPDSTSEDRAREFGKMLLECVPCFDRLLDPGSLLPSGDLLEIHAMNIKIRTDILDKIRELFKDPGFYIDICELLKLLSHICPQDLLAILIALTQYLAKLNLDVKFNINFIIQLVGPILSPFLDALSAWLDKWVQLILGPLLCIVDHINETIMLVQKAKIPFSDISGNVELDVGSAWPGHQNQSGLFNLGGDTGIGTNEGTAAGPHASTWGSWHWEHFETPDDQKYNPDVPEYPVEETQMAGEEIANEWPRTSNNFRRGRTDGPEKYPFSEEEREERNKRWQELKAAEEAKRRKVPPPDRPYNNNGTRWSKDDIPNSEKQTAGGSFDAGYYPPEKQRKPSQAAGYVDVSPLVNSVVQLRNILQGAIQYIRDWFTYITQMVYDLLGTDIGWMTKKADSTMLKSRIIQLIQMIRAIIKAISKNGLECGLHSNYSPAQMRYIVEDELNNTSQYYKFKVNDDNSIAVVTPDENPDSDIIDNSEVDPDGTDTVPADKTPIPGVIPGEDISEPSSDEQTSVKSGIIVKDCFKDVSHDDIEKVRSWIQDFERGGI